MGREFRSGTKSGNGIMQTQTDQKFRCENRSAGRLERVAHA